MKIDKIESVTNRYLNPVDAVKLYTVASMHTSKMQENPFKGSVSFLGLFNFGEAGQINGGTKPEYFADGTVYEPKTICWA